MTQGSPENAAEILKQVVAIQPQDRLSAELLETLTPKDQSESSPGQSTSPPAIAAAPSAKPPTGGLVPAAEPSTTEPPPGPSMPSGPLPTKIIGSWSGQTQRRM